MSTFNTFKTLSMTLAAAAICVGLQAQATTINAPLQFTTNQSIWGPSGNPFHYSDSTSYDFPIIGNQTFGYNVGATTGNVSGSVNGTLATTYASALSAPGTTSIGLGYSGDPNGGALDTSVGVGALVTVFNKTFGPSFTMNDNGHLISPVLGSFNPAEYVFPYFDQVLNPSFDVFGFSAGLSLVMQEFNYFTPNSIDGTLFYQLEGSNVVNSQDFNLGGNLALPVDLNQSGTYDFWFGNWSLNNQFSWNVSLFLGANESTPVGCGTLYLQSCNWSQTLANPTIYDSGNFALDFGAEALNPFQITVGNVVAAPEPRFLGLGMLGAGALLLCLFDVRRRRRTSA